MLNRSGQVPDAFGAWLNPPEANNYGRFRMAVSVMCHPSAGYMKDGSAINTNIG